MQECLAECSRPWQLPLPASTGENSPSPIVLNKDQYPAECSQRPHLAAV